LLPLKRDFPRYSPKQNAVPPAQK